MSKPKFKIGDKVRILDGGGIDDYTGGFPSDMARFVGKVATVRSVEPWPGGRIAYLLEGARRIGNVGGYSWDERGLELVGDAREQVVIYRCGRSVFAKDLMTHRIAEAKCSPEDEFDFFKGAALALDRLFDREEPKPEEPKPEEPKPEEPKYYNGNVVCVERGPGKLGALEETGLYWWTVGKVYDVVNGVIRDDDGDRRRPVKTLEELNELEDKYAKFVALVGPEKDAPNYYNGRVVCVEKSSPCWFWTPGKVYEIKDGVILDDDGDPRRNIRSVAALNALAYGSAKFIALADSKLEEPKYYTGKVVCVKKGPGMSGDANVTWWTVGKTYNVVDGVIKDDDGSPRKPAESLTDLNRITSNYAEFIALVE